MRVTGCGTLCVCVYLLSSGREARVPADATQQVELTLSVAAQVDGPGRDVDVHEVVDDPALDVVLHSVHQVSAAHVEDLDVGEIPVIKNIKRTYSSQPRVCMYRIHVGLRYLSLSSSIGM